MKKALLLLSMLCMLLPLAGQAITVECDLSGNLCDGGSGTTLGTVTRDMFYSITLSAAESIDFFQNGWFDGGLPSGWDSQASDFIVVDSSGVDQGWLIAVEAGGEPWGNFTPHGGTGSAAGTTDAILTWNENGGGSISDGTYYFGYNTTQPFADVGFLTATTVLNEDWDEAVGQGLGPIHAPVPEPATALLLFVSAGVVGVIRRIRRQYGQ